MSAGVEIESLLVVVDEARAHLLGLTGDDKVAYLAEQAELRRHREEHPPVIGSSEWIEEQAQFAVAMRAAEAANAAALVKLEATAARERAERAERDREVAEHQYNRIRASQAAQWGGTVVEGEVVQSEITPPARPALLPARRRASTVRVVDLLGRRDD